jgi:hypothetical protein
METTHLPKTLVFLQLRRLGLAFLVKNITHSAFEGLTSHAYVLHRVEGCFDFNEVYVLSYTDLIR